jgi:hypothetical protein
MIARNASLRKTLNEPGRMSGVVANLASAATMVAESTPMANAVPAAIMTFAT